MCLVWFNPQRHTGVHFDPTDGFNVCIFFILIQSFVFLTLLTCISITAVKFNENRATHVKNILTDKIVGSRLHTLAE